MTKTGLFVGSVDYAAPEQVRGEATSARTDVYALGAMLYQVLTGAVPFDRPTDVAKMYAHITEPPPVVTALRPDVPAAFDAIVAKAMAKEPEERYASAGELARAAVAALRAAPSWAAPPSSAPSWATVAGSHPRRRRRRPLRLLPQPVPRPSLSAAVPAGPAPSWAAAPADGNPSRAEAGDAGGCGDSNWGSLPRPPTVAAYSDSRWPKLLLGAALPLVLVLGIAAAVFAAAGGEDETAPPEPTVVAEATATATATAEVQPARAAATIEVGEGPDGVAVSDGRVFVANQRGGTLSRPRPADQRARRGADPGRHAAGRRRRRQGRHLGRRRRLRHRRALRIPGRARPHRQRGRRRPPRGDLARQAAPVGRELQRRDRQPRRPRHAVARRRPDRRRPRARPGSSSAAASCG